MTEKLKNIVNFNQPFKIRFSDGEDMNVIIVKQKLERPIQDLPQGKETCYWCSKDSPLAKAALGHTFGETVEYSAANNQVQVTILENRV